MLKQVLQQNSSKTEAKSNQRQRQTLAPRLSVFGTRMESSIHSVTYVTREAASASEVEHATAWMVGSSTIEGIDLNAEIPCEARDHDHPADLRITRTCGPCEPITRAVCRLVYETMLDLMAGGDVCRSCRRPVTVRIVEVLR